MARRTVIAVLVVAAAQFAGCSIDAVMDAGAGDASRIDAARLDAGRADAGSTDAGPIDAGVDAGGADAGQVDGGMGDAGVDAGMPTDAGTWMDASTIDAGARDAGIDAGPYDAGPDWSGTSNACRENRGDYVDDVYVAPDGTITVVGRSQRYYLRESWDALVVQFSPSGAIRWQHRLGGSGDDAFVTVLPATSGGVIAIGNTRSHSAIGASQGWVVRFDASGGVVGERVFGDAYSLELNAALTTADGGLLVIGEILTRSYARDGWLAKLDAAFDPEWQITGGSNDYEDLLSGAELPDGYLIAGRGPSRATTISGC